MSLHGSTPIAVAEPRAWFKRWYQGPDVTIRARGCPPLRTTPNHLVLTYRGWQPARLVYGWVLAHSARQTVTVSELHDGLTDVRPGALQVFGRDFRGDGDHFPAHVAAGPDADLRRPLVGEESEPPAVDPRTTWEVLGALSTAQGFGYATWQGACGNVPDLERTWPAGEPSRRALGVPEHRARRLGPALAELPQPKVDLTALSLALLGLPGALELVPVESVEEDRAGAWFHDVITEAGCYTASGLIVA